MERVGEHRCNNTGHRMEIVEYRGSKDITIRWECGNTQTTTYNYFKNGSIRYPLHRGFLGKGYLGFGKYVAGKPRDGQVVVPKYVTDCWRSMLHRVYNKDYLGETKNAGYLDTVICEDWLNFQNFAEWSLSQIGCGGKDEKGVYFQLDKDILGGCEKCYSPQICVFVPKEINIFFSKKSVGEYGRGVKAVRKKGVIQGYSSTVSEFGRDVYLGFYPTPKEAQMVHDIAKKNIALKLADKWEGLIDGRVVERLRNFDLSFILKG